MSRLGERLQSNNRHQIHLRQAPHRDFIVNKEPIVPKLKPIDNVKPIPVTKKCHVCKQLKLLSEFTLDMTLKTKDHRARTCNSCMEQEEGNCHSADCIEGKFLQAVEAQLDTLLALAEDGMLIPDEILELMGNIVAQNEENMKKDERD